MSRKPRPGVSHRQRPLDERLQRLARQLAAGAAMSDAVLAQWIRRYGEPARALIRQHGRYHAGLENAAPRHD